MIAGVEPKPRRPTLQHLRGPNDVALELTGRNYISYSAISSYQRCPLRYFFSYVVGLEPEFTASSLVFGGAIHAAIESHFRSLFEGATPPSLDKLVGKYETAWGAEAGALIRFGKTESADGLRDLAARMLKAFQASEVSKLDTRLLGVEEELRGPVIDGCPNLLGRIDLITMEPEALLITDYKTSRSSWSQGKVREAAPQQLLYVGLVEPLAEACGNRPIRIEWIVITKAKKPVVERHPLTPDPRSIARTKAVVRRVWEAIQSNHFYPAASSMNCPTCPYQNACQAWEG